MTRDRSEDGQDRRRRVTRSVARDVVGLLLALVGLGVLLLAATALSGGLPFDDPVALRGYVLEFGPLAPLAFVGLQAAQVIVAPIPGQVLGLVSGFLFGPFYGTLYGVVGAAIGSYVVFALSRRYGRGYVERTVGPATLARFDGVVDRHGLFGLFLVFLVPGLPDDAVCFAAGLTDLDLRAMVVVSTVGRVPGYFVINLAGARLVEYRPLDSILLLGGLAAISLAVYLVRDRLLGAPRP